MPSQDYAVMLGLMVKFLCRAKYRTLSGVGIQCYIQCLTGHKRLSLHRSRPIETSVAI